MTRKQWLVVAALGLVNAGILCGMAALFLYSLRQSPPPLPTAQATAVQSTATSIPTWTPTLSPTPEPTRTPRPTGEPKETPTPIPTFTPSPTPTPTPMEVLLQNPTFEGITENDVPGWRLGSFVNWVPGQEFDPGTCFAAPRFHQADDPGQRINGATLQIDTVNWVKLRAWVYQTVTVTAGSRVQFQARAFGFVYDTNGGYILKAGVDRHGREGCDAAQWGSEHIVNQHAGIITIASPKVIAGEEGRVTVCLFAETQYAQIYHAAFFDDAELIVTPP